MRCTPPDAECISQGKARMPYGFGVKVSLAVTHRHGLVVGARSFLGNPYDGHALAAQIERTTSALGHRREAQDGRRRRGLARRG